MFFHLGGGEARGDVLRAVPVVGNDLDEEQSLHFAAERFWGEFLDVWIISPSDGLPARQVPSWPTQ